MTISKKFPFGVSLLGLAVIGVAFAQRSALIRRVLILSVFGIAALSAAMTIAGWYLPIFQLAGSIKTD